MTDDRIDPTPTPSVESGDELFVPGSASPRAADEPEPEKKPKGSPDARQGAKNKPKGNTDAGSHRS